MVMTINSPSIFKESTERQRTARDLVLKGTNLRGVQLTGLRADHLDLEDTDLREASLTEVKWKACILRDARFDGADFTDAVIRMCDLDRARATNATFVRTRLENNTARAACFDNADLTEAVLIETDFSRASFRNANLEAVSASGANFRGADLSGARLRNADLSDADFRGADLTDADLQGADLNGADLRGAVGHDPALQQEKNSWGDLPTEIKNLAETMAPIVGEVLRTGGRQGFVDSKTAERLIQEAAQYQNSSFANAPGPDMMKTVTKVLGQFEGDILSQLLRALQQPNDSEPPPEVKAMILQLRQAFSLGQTASAEDVLSHLTNGMRRSSRGS